MSAAGRERSQPIDVFLLTGFLGSGKTSLINRMVAPDGPLTAVIVNEFGDIGIDNDLVSVGETGMSVAETTTGCICCSPGNGIVQTLARLSDAIDAGQAGEVERVVIETTGLADPAPIINDMLIATNSTIGGRYFHLAAVIATLDAVRGKQTIDERLVGHKQLAFADRIALTKSDMLGHDMMARRDDIDALLARVNPGAHVIDVQAPLAQPETLLRPGSYGAAERGADVAAWLAAESPIAKSFAKKDFGFAAPSRHSGIYTKSAVLEGVVNANKLLSFIDMLRRAGGKQLLRLKGLVALEDDPSRPMLIHIVQGVFYPPVRLDAWPSADERTRLVVIAESLDEDALENFMKTLEQKPRRKRA